jgi:hypothetical protein
MKLFAVFALFAAGLSAQTVILYGPSPSNPYTCPAGQVLNSVTLSGFTCVTVAGGSTAWSAITGIPANVTNAVSTAGSYPSPSWLPSINWAILTNIPTFVTPVTLDNGSLPIAGTTLAGGTPGSPFCLHAYDGSTPTPIDTPLCAPTTANGFLYMGGTAIGSRLGLGSIKVSAAGVMFPAADSTTAIQIDAANGSTPVISVDTTDGFVGINTATPGVALEVSGTTQVDGTFVLAKQPTTFTGTSGTGSCYAAIWGPAEKKFVCTLVSYAQTGTAQTFTFPTSPGPFTAAPLLQQVSGASQIHCGTYDATVTTTALTLPANAAMTTQTCTIIGDGR